MKEWFSAKEIADLHLPSLPCSERNIQLKSKRENWKSRAREGRGGGKEYHISALPEVARIQLVVMTAPAAKKEAVKTEGIGGIRPYRRTGEKPNRRKVGNLGSVQRISEIAGICEHPRPLHFCGKV